MELDHVVLWVSDPHAALRFYVDVVGLTPVRAAEFEEGRAPFPSVRLNDATILDLMDRELVPFVRDFTAGGEESGGASINHVCFAMPAAEYTALTARLSERGIALKPAGAGSFGARGGAVDAAYFRDPDGNVLEMRYYEEPA
jgi:glyoxylase I family protein